MTITTVSRMSKNDRRKLERKIRKVFKIRLLIKTIVSNVAVSSVKRHEQLRFQINAKELLIKKY